MRKTRVLVVDDSAVVRRLVADVLASDPQIEVAGTAPHGRAALEALPRTRPDLVTLDIEMPELDGLETLRRLRADHPGVPVIMFSILTERGAAATLDALALGAVDYVTKPSRRAGPREALRSIRAELLPKIKAICARDRFTGAGELAAPGEEPPEVVAIAASTGGPAALVRLLARLPHDFALPVIVVQHMPPLFTRLFSRRLDAQLALPAGEAQAGAALEGGRIHVAPGGVHLRVEAGCLETCDSPPENSCRPSADVLFRSVADAYGPRTLAVVLTGMGADGLSGCAAVREAKGRVVAQDRSSSVVWGMPGGVVSARLAETIGSPEELGDFIARLVREPAGAGKA